MPPSLTFVSAGRAAATRYLSCIRVPDVLVLQGPPLLGAAFALRQEAPSRIDDIALLLAANVCLMAHVFLLNDWSNLAADLADPFKAGDVFTAKGVGRPEIAAIGALLLVAALVLSARLGPVSFLLALGIAGLSALYSLPGAGFKGRPLLNSATHLIGGVLHFQFGYALGGVFDLNGWLLATFFALTFTAGHLAQEVRDHDGDVRMGVRTNAVSFGPKRTFVASVAVFTLSQALLFSMALWGTVPRALAALALLHPLQLRWSVVAFDEGLTHASLCRLQARYRLLYGAIGVAMIAALWVG